MTSDEIRTLNDIIREYRGIDEEMQTLGRQLSELTKRNRELQERLAKCKEREESFTGTLKERYGKVDYNELLGLIDRNDYIDEKEKPAE